MNAHAAGRSSAPDVDEGDARDLAAVLRRELRPTPGRLGDSVRIVAVVLIVVAISETFRIPDIAVSAYIVLFLSGREAASTVRTALVAGIAVVLAIFATIAVFMLSLSEPAIRIPLIAITTFGAMFLSRASPLGPVFFVAGFILAYGLTLGDQVLGLALQPSTAGNAAQFELPEIFFVPPEEALVHFLLWLSLAVALPIALLIAANLLTGRDPALLLRRALVERLATSARFCASERGAEHQLEGQAFEGTAELRKLHHLAGLLHRGRGRPVWGASLIDDIARLGLLLLSWLRVEGKDRNPLVSAAGACREAERALQDGKAPSGEPVTITATGAARPLAVAISRTLHAIRETLVGTPPGQKTHDAAEAPRRLLAADVSSNPEYAEAETDPADAVPEIPATPLSAAFLGQAFRNLTAFSVDGAIHFVCMDWRHVEELLAAGREAYGELKNICVWVKDNAGMGSFYRSRHELVCVFKYGRNGHRNNIQLGQFGRNRSNVWHYPGANSFTRSSEEGNLLALHPTVKPVAMVADAILDCSARHTVTVRVCRPQRE